VYGLQPMIPRPYSTFVSVTQAAVALAVVVCATVAAMFDKVSGDALIGLYSGIVGFVLGSAGTIHGANGAAVRVEQAVWRGVADAVEPDHPPPPGVERRGLRIHKRGEDT
jgi:hypothetical protein